MPSRLEEIKDTSTAARNFMAQYSSLIVTLRAILELGQAPSSLLALEEALHHGRYRTEGDSHAAPRPDPRARLGVPPPPVLARSEKTASCSCTIMRLKCDE